MTVSELMLASSGLDMKLLKPLLYYQGADLAVHRTSRNVVMHYELRPNSKARVAQVRTVSVNSLGFRGAERAKAKPKGVFRIVCIGGSNTYGNVNDAETYPAQLEKLLNAAQPGRYEVWNAGLSASVLTQNVEQARNILNDYSPDMLLFQISNAGRRAFLFDEPFEYYFQNDPGLYAENLYFPPFGRNRVHLTLMRHWRLYRTAIIAVNHLRRYAAHREQDHSPEADGFNLAAMNDFCARYQAKIPIILLYYPGLLPEHPSDPMGLRTIVLADKLPARHPPDYDELHPPAYVYSWYARMIMESLRKYGVLPS